MGNITGLSVVDCDESTSKTPEMFNSVTNTVIDHYKIEELDETIVRIPEYKDEEERKLKKKEIESVQLNNDNYIKKYGLMSVLITQNPQRTFSKNLYKRICDIKTIRKEYIFENNTVQIDIGVKINKAVVRTIKDMWVTNADNIINFKLYFVTNKNVYCDLSGTALKNINKMMYRDDYDNYIKLNILRIPIDEYSIVTGLASDNIIVDIITKTPNNHMLYTNYKIITDPQEINRFNSCGHEYLIRQYITTTESIKKGDNILNIRGTRLEISHMFINSKKSLKLNIKSNIYNAYDCEDVHLYEVSTDPEYNKYEINSHDTYIFDVYKNVNNTTLQPYGVTLLNDDTKIYITSTEDTNIEITYVIYNVVRYFNNLRGFVVNYFPEK
jgi:hypothetical protein